MNESKRLPFFARLIAVLTGFGGVIILTEHLTGIASFQAGSILVQPFSKAIYFSGLIAVVIGAVFLWFRKFIAMYLYLVGFFSSLINFYIASRRWTNHHEWKSGLFELTFSAIIWIYVWRVVMFRHAPKAFNSNA